MWKVVFHLKDRHGTGIIVESGFENKGQAEAWLATGARKRYGYRFWHDCVEIEVIEMEGPYIRGGL